MFKNMDNLLMKQPDKYHIFINKIGKKKTKRKNN